MEREDAARLILDGYEKGRLSIKWNLFERVGKKKSYHNIIKEGEQQGFLIEVCSGCGQPTSDRDCGCPAGTSLRWN
jgi:hypothetical protein